MKSPLETIDVRHFIKELSDVNTKLIKGTEALVGIENVDVGTAPKELLYEEDKLRLYHYAPEGTVSCSVPVLIVYALVNRQYMLDLQPDRSIVRNLLRVVDSLPALNVVGVVLILRSSERARFGDRIAGTRVVRCFEAITVLVEQIDVMNNHASRSFRLEIAFWSFEYRERSRVIRV